MRCVFPDCGCPTAYPCYYDDAEEDEMSDELKRLLMPPKKKIPNSVVGIPCHWCGVPMTQKPRVRMREKPAPTAATRDHRIPVSRGGRNSKTNIVWSCYKCNQEKGNMNLRAWLATRPNNAQR